MAGIITRVSGPLVQATGLDNPIMYEVVKVGDTGLFGEIIGIEGEGVSIQVYEEDVSTQFLFGRSRFYFS